MPKFCSECGFRFGEDAPKFCSECGAPVGGEDSSLIASEAPPPTAPVAPSGSPDPSSDPIAHALAVLTAAKQNEPSVAVLQEHELERRPTGNPNLVQYTTDIPMQLEGVIPKESYLRFVNALNELNSATYQVVNSWSTKHLIAMLLCWLIFPLALVCIANGKITTATKDGREKARTLVEQENQALSEEFPDKRVQWSLVEEQVVNDGTHTMPELTLGVPHFLLQWTVDLN
eukprot:TRINITY_DN66442_c2_g1_i1.p1 TRINITY_DN66442_c2_g1~~TRINITY_DN66442_c2_g1_i1.p1  ORF type:complete len:230 (-),score=7.65 TRINITY_DN66442_c2_g1_i1:56-745(-)